MSSLFRPRLFAAAALLLVVGAAWQYLGSAKADDRTPTTGRGPAGPSAKTPEPTADPSQRTLVLGSKDSAQPQNMEQFLTAVTKHVDGYWTKVFKQSGLPEPRVELPVDPGRPDRGERLRRRERGHGRQRRRVLPRR